MAAILNERPREQARSLGTPSLQPRSADTRTLKCRLKLRERSALDLTALTLTAAHCGHL